MTEVPAESDPIEDWMAECLLVAPDERRAALAELCRAHPEEAAEIRARANALEKMGVLPAQVAPAGAPERMGDFRLLERLGAGGMGVVYRAEQISLGREVALKLVRPELLYFPGARERFAREVDAIARLEHQNIVPVHAVGEENGVPYFAMGLVQGATLAQILTGLAGRKPSELDGSSLAQALEAAGHSPEAHGTTLFDLSWEDACCELARQASLALLHAHQRGLVHRDVKPSNLALDRRGRLLLLDFGLTSTQGTERMTRSGAQLGTPHYMAPEQLRGEAVDARADIYALGVTLYELLCLRVAFDGRSYEEVRLRVLAGAPANLREQNPRITRDLAAIVQTAMDIEPARRYASAAQLERDLASAMARESVMARPAGPGRIGLRWCKRHPVATAASGAAALLAIGIPSALYLQQKSHATELAESLQEKGKILAREQKALGELQLAHGELTAALAREEQLRADEVDARSAAETTVGILMNLIEGLQPGRLQGRSVDARTFLERGRAHLVELEQKPRELAYFATSLGMAYSAIGEHEQALGLLQRAQGLQEEIYGRASRQFVNLSANIAETLQFLGRHDEAEAVARDGLVAGIEFYGVDAPEVATLHGNVSVHCGTQGKLAEAEAEARRSLEILALHPPHLHQEVTTRGNLAHYLMNQGRLQEASEQAELTLSGLRNVLDPDLSWYASTLNLVALVRKAAGNVPGAEELYVQAIEIQDRIGEQRMLSALTRFNLAVLRLERQEHSSAAELLSRALGDMQATGPENAQHCELIRRHLALAEAALKQQHDGVPQR